MSFELRTFHAPDFTSAYLFSAPDAKMAPAPADAVAPSGFHAMSIYPEYFKVDGRWLLAEESRMDCVPVFENGKIAVKEFRRLKKGEKVILGRTEDGSEGIFVYPSGFHDPDDGKRDVFAFRLNRSRETAFSRDYDELYEILRHDRDHGKIVWVMGPAFAFDHDVQPNGHYNHLDTINRVKQCGNIPAFLEQENIDNGIIWSCEKHCVPYVLAGSIRDDGPLPPVLGNVYEAQDRMRDEVKSATTVLCLATTLHSIAVGNMTPSYRVLPDGTVREVYFYCVDISEFTANKLSDRGSLSAKGIVTNVQDFIVTLRKGLGL